MDGAHIENCTLRFAFQCPKQWANLKQTLDPAVRYCDECRQSVHLCSNKDQARQHARAGNCVALSVHLVRKESHVENGGFVQYVAGQLEHQPPPKWLVVGTQIQVTAGPFRGTEGVVVSIWKGRQTVTVSATLFGSRISLEVDYTCVEPK